MRIHYAEPSHTSAYRLRTDHGGYRSAERLLLTVRIYADNLRSSCPISAFRSAKLWHNHSPVSLYDPVYTDGGDALYVMDQISDKHNREDRWVESLSLNDAMKRLNTREHHIIKLRFFEGKTQMEVAEEIHISQAQVSRLEKSALKSMKTYLATDPICRKVP